MLKRKFSKLNEIGSLMVEAMAMLALISMVTPILYRKAAERTSELQDINAASQVRSLIKSVDDYVKDNYDDLIGGRAITQAECSTTSVNYSTLAGASGNVTVPIDHFCNYLPYGFLGTDKKAQDSKTFSKNYKVVLKKASGDAERKKTITAFLVANPTGNDLPALRSSRIASMIGSNGGYIEGNRGNGVQGIWGVNNLGTDLGLASSDYKNGAIMASSMQSISASGGGDSSENVLYRNKRAGKDYLNTMETHLSMGEVAGRQYNIKNINQLIVGANSTDQMEGGIEKALYLKKGGIDVGGKASIASSGAISGTTGSFSGLVTGAGYSGGPVSGTTGTFTGDVKGAKGTFTGDVSGAKGIFSGAVTGASYSGGPISGTTGTFSGAVTAASLSTGAGAITGGPITGTIGTFTTKVVTPLLDATDIIGNVVTARNTLNVGVNGVDAMVNNTGAYFKKDIFEVGASGAKVKITGTTTKIRNSSVDIGTSDARGLVVDGSGVDLSSDLKTIVFGKTGVNIGTDPNQIVNIQSDLLKATMPAAGAKGLVAVRDDLTAIDAKFKATRVGSASTLAFSPFTDTAGDAVIYANHTDSGSAPRLDIKSNVLQVDSNATSGYNSVASGTVPSGQTAARGSVYVRDGAVELRSKYSSIDSTTSGTNSKDSNRLFSGHIKADRFVDNRRLDHSNPILNNAATINGYTMPTSGVYDAYQVNPAYTSVMHDIKLTTRGGARLSDILPDFINKGIYVVDNTYNENVGNWEGLTTIAQLQTHGDGKDCGVHTCRTSPWLGWVPPPQCPPGYGKVITITPAGWAMAQAGTPGKSTAGSRKSPDIAIAYDPRRVTDPLYDADPNTVATPLYFQKSTWLRANVFPHGSQAGFAGWSAIMGFMYPYSYYKDYLGHLGLTPAGANDKTIVWNLFPVFKQQLEAYATVYCYFDRSSFKNEYVGDYDQLTNKRAVYTKGNATFTNRLNDETLPYTDPW